MSWVCPHCGTTATVQKVNLDMGSAGVVIDSAPDNEGIQIVWQAIRCPAKSCGKFVLDVQAHFGACEKNQYESRNGKVRGDVSRPVGAGKFRFEPRVGKPLSRHAPQSVVNDYNEACLIKDLSPKAAATLCRRALQGMIRDFWGISMGTLAAELKAIEPQCDQALYTAMSSLRSIGNIGAHPERDINLIIDVEEGEVDALLGLLHILDIDWYVARAAKAERLASITALGATKAAQKATGGSPSSAGAS